MKNGDEMINDDDGWNDNAEWQWITRLSRNDDFCIRCDCRWMQWSKKPPKVSKNFNQKQNANKTSLLIV